MCWYVETLRFIMLQLYVEPLSWSWSFNLNYPWLTLSFEYLLSDQVVEKENVCIASFLNIPNQQQFQRSAYVTCKNVLQFLKSTLQDIKCCL